MMRLAGILRKTEFSPNHVVNDPSANSVSCACITSPAPYSGTWSHVTTARAGIDPFAGNVFMRTAPPMVPGTPTAHSKPVSPCAALRRAATGRRVAPPARSSSSSSTTKSNAAPSTIASPRNPRSATSRFDPLPTTSTSTAVRDTTRATSSTSRSVAHVTKRSAAPPTR